MKNKRTLGSLMSVIFVFSSLFSIFFSSQLLAQADLSGTIVDSSDGVTPINSVTVYLLDPVTGANLNTTAATDSNGNYSFTGLTEGLYKVFFHPNGSAAHYRHELYNEVPCRNGSCDTAALGITIDLVTGANTLDEDLTPTALLSGMVVDSADGTTPVYPVIIDLADPDTGNWLNIGISNNPDGSYAFPPLEPGTYKIHFNAINEANSYIDELYDEVACDNGGCDVAALGSPITLNLGANIQDEDLTMGAPPGGSLTGTIVDQSDWSIQVNPVTIELFMEDGTTTGYSTENNPDGSYQITGISPGTYKVLFNAHDAANTYGDELYDDIACNGGSCPIGAVGSTIAIADTEVTLNEELIHGGSISGVISSSVTGQPVGNWEARARLYQTDGTQITTTLTNELGEYNFGGVPAGDYFVVLAPRYSNLVDELYDDIKCPRLSCDTASGSVITISSGTVITGIDGTLDPGSIITGTILQDGAPVQDAIFYIFTAAGDYAGFGRSDENGFITTGSGLPAGSYYFAQYGNGILNTSYPNVPCGDPCDATVGTLVTVDGTNNAVNIDFLAVSGDVSTAYVSGSVTADEGGAPLNDINICVVNKNDPGFDACQVTDAQGSYLISGLDKINDYVVYTRDVGGKAFFPEVFDSLDCCDTSAGTSVDLTSTNALINFGLATSGLITGYIQDVATNQPIANVSVQLYDSDGLHVNSIEAFTDDGAFPGQYAISGVPDGVYYVFAESEWQGYVNELYPNIQRFRPWLDGGTTDGQPVVIENHTQVNGIDFDLDPGGSISGTVSTSSGLMPNNGARIRIYHSGDRTPLHQVGNWNEDDSYTIHGVPPGNYDILLTSTRQSLIGERFDDVYCPRNSCDFSLGNSVVVGQAEHVSGIDAVLDPGAQVTGSITDAGTGLGVAGLCVGIYTADGIYATFGCTDQDGNYGTFTGLPPGEYIAANQIFSNEITGGFVPQVWQEDGSFVSCGVPCNVQLSDTFTVTGLTVSHVVDMAMQSGSTISGNVQFGGGAAVGVEVLLLDDTAQLVKSVDTDSSGNYVLEGVNSGIHYVRTMNNLGYLDQLHAEPTDVTCSPDCNPFSGDVINVDGNSTYSGIDFELLTAGIISGVVTDQDDAPISGVTVEVYNNLGSLTGSAITNVAGEYSVGGLGNNNYFVRTRNLLGYAEALYDAMKCVGDCNVTEGAPVSVSLGAVTAGIDIGLDGGAEFTGLLKDENGTPVGATIDVYSQTGDLVASRSFGGSYHIGGLAPGTYWLVARNSNLVDMAGDGTPCVASCNPLIKTPFTLGVGETKSVDFSLLVSSLNVKTIDPVKVAGAGEVSVIAYDLNGVEISRNKTKNYTSYVGSTVLRGVPPGTQVYLRTENNVGYLDSIYDGLACVGECDVTEGTKVTAPIDWDAPGMPEFVLQGGGSISGHVYVEGSNPLTPIARVGIRLRTRSGVYLTTETDATGAYHFNGLSDDAYYVLTLGELDFVHKVLGGDTCSPTICDVFEGEPITISSDVHMDKDLYLTPATTRLTGYANDANGNSILTGVIWVWDYAGNFVKNNPVNGDGTFTVYGLAVGTYYLSFSGSGGSALVQTLYKGIPCPGSVCDKTTGAPIVIANPASGGATVQMSSVALASGPQKGSFATAIEPQIVSISMEIESGYLIRGSVEDSQNRPVTFKPVYIFDAEGNSMTDATTDGLGNFVTPVGLPNGTYFAATSRTARLDDTQEQAADAADGIGLGLQDQVWNGDACDGICAPSVSSGTGTEIVISGDDVENIHFVLTRAPGISVEKLTNGQDAGTPNGGEAPAILPGATVTWTYRLTNTGGDDLIEVVVVDDKGVNVTCPGTTLAPDASMDCSGSGAAADLSADPFTGVMGNCMGVAGSRLYQNTATVSAKTAGGTVVGDSDSSHYCNTNPVDGVIFNNGFE